MNRFGIKRIAALVLILAAGGLLFYIYALHERETPALAPTPPSTQTIPDDTVQEPLVKIGSLEIPVELALTQKEREQGLSGRASLDMDRGMLFVFPEPDFYQFWMPDMNFPIDIIWINSNQEIAGISENVSNEFDPLNPRFYSPPVPAQYVLEVNAGFSAKAGVGVGNIVSFQNIGPALD